MSGWFDGLVEYVELFETTSIAEIRDLCRLQI